MTKRAHTTVDLGFLKARGFAGGVRATMEAHWCSSHFVTAQLNLVSFCAFKVTYLRLVHYERRLFPEKHL